MIQAVRNLGFINNYNNSQKRVSFGIDRMPWYLVKTEEGDSFIPSKEVDAPETLSNDELKERIPNKFIVWAEETDFIKNGLKESLKPENLIGEGFEHAAYSIPNNDKYVLRILRDFYKETQNIDYSDYKMEDTRDMELIGNYGQEVALLSPANNIGDYKPKIEVLKKQNGFPNANCSPRALFHEDGTYREEVVPYEDNSRKEHFAYSMKTLAEFPDETYDKLIEDLLVAGEAGYRFDHHNANNFLIDTENKRINLIDMPKVRKPYKDRFGNTLYALINYEFLGEYLNKNSGYQPKNPNEINETIGNMITIVNKYTKAMQKRLQKYNIHSYEFYNFLRDSYSVSSFWLGTMDFEEKLQKLRNMDVLYEGKDSDYK